MPRVSAGNTNRRDYAEGQLRYAANVADTSARMQVAERSPFSVRRTDFECGRAVGADEALADRRLRRCASLLWTPADRPGQSNQRSFSGPYPWRVCDLEDFAVELAEASGFIDRVGALEIDRELAILMKAVRSVGGFSTQTG